MLVPDYVLAVIHAIRSELVKAGEQDEDSCDWYVSDRRWKKVVQVLRTSAYLNGRDHVDLMDCVLIKYCIWNDEAQLKQVEEIVCKTLRNHGYTLQFDLGNIREEMVLLQEDIRKETEFEVVTGRQPIFTPDSNGLVEFSPRYKEYYNDVYDQIKLSEFEMLGIRSYEDLSLENCNGKLELQVERISETIFEIDNNVYELAHDLQDVVETRAKTAHPEVRKAWDKQAKKMQTQLSNHISALDLYRKNELATLRTNLFVDGEWVDVIEQHLSESRAELESIKIDIKQVQESYAAKKKGGRKTKQITCVIDDERETDAPKRFRRYK